MTTTTEKRFTYSELTSRFRAAFANVPLGERKNPIHTSHDTGAMSWYVVRLEVDSGSEKGEEALRVMHELKII